jgi:hypothetical protein
MPVTSGLGSGRAVGSFLAQLGVAKGRAYPGHWYSLGVDIDSKEMGRWTCCWIDLAQDWRKWWDLVSAVMNPPLQCTIKRGNCLSGRGTATVSPAL